jgi:hypothetical protein
MRKQFLIRLVVRAVLAWGISVVVSNHTWSFFCIGIVCWAVLYWLWKWQGRDRNRITRSRLRSALRTVIALVAGAGLISPRRVLSALDNGQDFGLPPGFGLGRPFFQRVAAPMAGSNPVKSHSLHRKQSFHIFDPLRIELLAADQFARLVRA